MVILGGSLALLASRTKNSFLGKLRRLLVANQPVQARYLMSRRLGGIRGKGGENVLDCFYAPGTPLQTKNTKREEQLEKHPAGNLPTRGLGVPRQALRTSIKSHFLKILITFGDKCPQNGSNNATMAPRTHLG